MPPTIEILAAATGSTGGLGKTGTLVQNATMWVRVPVNDGTARVKVWPKCNKAHEVQAYLGADDALLTGTITLADAAALEDTDSFEFNGLTFIAETTEAQVDITNREWYHPSQAAGAVNLCALLNDATYGVPGFTFTSEAVGATDVITFVSTTATALLFNQGTSDAAEIAFAATCAANLRPEGALLSGKAANTTTKGYAVELWNDGLVPYFSLKQTEALAATVVFEAARFPS